jgi:hypothetical protein
MKVYVQDTSTLYFLCRDASWSPDISKARDFENTATAILFCSSRLNKPFQLLLRFADPQFDMTLPGSPHLAD